MVTLTHLLRGFGYARNIAPTNQGPGKARAFRLHKPQAAGEIADMTYFGFRSFRV